MKHLNIRLILTCMTVLLMTGLGSALAADASDNSAKKAELRARFENRFPQILQYKHDGKIGETTEGMIEAVDRKYMDDTALAKLVNEENSDRQSLYNLIAQEENTTPPLVARRMAQRNFERARPGEYLKAADGTWKKKS